MPVRIPVTFDFFFRDWASDGGVLWLAIQPHVVFDPRPGSAQDDLTPWIEDASGTLTEGSHEPVDAATVDGNRLVPVPLPERTDLLVDLVRRNGSVARSIAVDRKQDRKIPSAAGAESFAADNGHGAGAGVGTVDPSRQPMAGPFAKTYVEALRAQLAAEPAAVGRLAQMLTLAFHGGTTRWVRLGETFAIDDATQLFTLPPGYESAPAGVTVTDHHALLGLIVPLLDKPSWNALKTVDPALALRVTLVQDGNRQEIPLDGVAEAMRAWFVALAVAADADLDDPGRFVRERVTVPDGLAARVYVVDNPEAFAQVVRSPTAGQAQVIGALIWRRGKRSGSAGRPINDMVRLVVRPQAGPLASNLTPTPLQWRALTAVDAELRPYRGQAAADAGAPRVFELAAAPGSEARLAAALPAGQTDPWPAGAILLDVAGNAITVGSGTDTFVWLGAYDLRLSAVPGTPGLSYLFHGQVMPGPVTLFVDAANGPVVTPWTEDERGPRWEFAASIVGTTLPFDALHLLNPADLPAGIVLDALRPGVVFQDSRGFVAAQSVGRIEGVVRVGYPKLDSSGNNPAAMSPTVDFAADAVNHNALDVRERQSTGTPGRSYHPEAELFPVYVRLIEMGAAVELTYHWRFAETIEPALEATADGSLPPLPADDVRKVFASVYGRVGTPRPLSLDLVHTYGTRIEDIRPGTDPITAPRPHVLQPLSPAEVGLARVQRAGAPPAGDTAPFVTVRFVGDEPVLELALASDLLANFPGWSGPGVGRSAAEARRAALVAAWRSLFEVADAAALRLVGTFRRFENHGVLGSGPATPLARGLMPVPGLAFAADLAPLATEVRGFLAGTSALPASWRIAIEPTTYQRIRDLCHLVEMTLVLERRAATWPPARPALVRVRHEPGEQDRPDRFDENGRRVVDASDAGSLYGPWRDGMTGRRRAVRPAPSLNEGPSITAIFGAGGAPDTAGDDPPGAAWMAAPGTAVAGGEAALVVYPLGFVPLLPDPRFGEGTTRVLRRCFEALALLVDAVPGVWIAQSSRDAWRQHFARMAAPAGTASPDDTMIRGLLRSALALLRPAHRSDDPAVAEPVAAAIGGFSAIAAGVRDDLATRPGVFGSAKAVRLAHLTGPEGAGPPPFDVVRLRSRLHTGEGAVELVDDLRAAVGGAPDVLGATVATALDDRVYGEVVWIDNVTVQPFEALADASASAPFRPIDPAHLHVPRPPASSTDTARPLELPAREPPQLPQLLVIGRVTGTNDSAWPTAFGSISSRALVAERKIAAPAGDALIRRAWVPGKLASSATRLDLVAVTAAFRVVADEEQDFDHDMFSVLVEEPGASAPPAPSAGPEQGDSVFARLGREQDLRTIATLGELVDPANVATVREVLKRTIDWADGPGALPPSPPERTRRFTLEGDRFVEEGVWTGSAAELVALALYVQPSGEVGAALRRGFLIVTVRLPVWRSQRIGLYLSRNWSPLIAVPGAPAAPSFAPVFQRTRGPAGLEAEAGLTLDAPGDKAQPWSIPSRTLSIDDLVTEALEDHNRIEPDTWRRFDLTVTVHHQQRLSALEAKPDGNESRQPMPLPAGTSLFPLRMAVRTAGATSSVTVSFPNPYRRFAVDFVWRRADGQEIFRIHGLPCTVG